MAYGSKQLGRKASKYKQFKVHGSREKPNAISDGEAGAYCQLGLLFEGLVEKRQEISF